MQLLTIVPVSISVAAESPLSNTRWRNTSASGTITLQASVAASGGTGNGTLLGEVALLATPDAASLPLVGDVEGLLSAGRSLPSGGVVGLDSADTHVGVHLRRRD